MPAPIPGHGPVRRMRLKPHLEVHDSKTLHRHNPSTEHGPTANDELYRAMDWRQLATPTTVQHRAMELVDQHVKNWRS